MHFIHMSSFDLPSNAPALIIFSFEHKFPPNLHNYKIKLIQNLRMEKKIKKNVANRSHLTDLFTLRSNNSLFFSMNDN